MAEIVSSNFASDSAPRLDFCKSLGDTQGPIQPARDFGQLLKRSAEEWSISRVEAIDAPCPCQSAINDPAAAQFVLRTGANRVVCDAVIGELKEQSFAELAEKLHYVAHQYCVMFSEARGVDFDIPTF